MPFADPWSLPSVGFTSARKAHDKTTPLNQRSDDRGSGGAPEMTQARAAKAEAADAQDAEVLDKDIKALSGVPRG